jgi:hypothetical protein
MTGKERGGAGCEKPSRPELQPLEVGPQHSEGGKRGHNCSWAEARRIPKFSQKNKKGTSLLLTLRLNPLRGTICSNRKKF